jgi:hypothetical protein
VAELLRKSGFDAISTPEAGRLEESDVSQLSWAAQEKRTLVSFNVPDFAALHTEWVQNGLDHSGVIVSKRIPIGAFVRRLVKLGTKLSAEQMVNGLIYLKESI